MGRRYLEMEISTASPELLVVRLYEAALRQARSAVAAVEAGRVRERGVAISKALAIVSELRGALDLERGGEIAGNLHGLYGFVTERLLEANLRGRAEPIGEALAVLERLQEAWVELAKRPGAASSAP